MYYKPYERPVVEYVDKLLELRSKRGSNLSVQTEGDWAIMDFIYKGWRTLFSEYADGFESQMRTWRAMTLNKMGVAKEGGAMLQHQLEVPEKLYAMIKIVYPMQKWDKKFIKKFSDRFPQFKGADTKL